MWTRQIRVAALFLKEQDTIIQEFVKWQHAIIVTFIDRARVGCPAYEIIAGDTTVFKDFSHGEYVTMKNPKNPWKIP